MVHVSDRPRLTTRPPVLAETRWGRLVFLPTVLAGSLGAVAMAVPPQAGLFVVSAVTISTVYTVTTGAVPSLAVTVDLNNSTQFGNSFGVAQLSQDGYKPGSLSGLTVEADGTILGNFSNGQSRTMGQVLLTNFRNSNGLVSVGGNQWQWTPAAGAVDGAGAPPGTGTLGVLQSAAVEESNVDLTGELVNMITQQRAYQANAQSIKTQDQILQTLVNLR